uniref:BAH domain-containing protein n=1 Tax=Rhizophagus irregularis (strain DAOM 181602 / DAOM 197198 / MUCL 43194) TaxID=747089 RepID=U9TUC4_RHIID
MPRNWKRIQSPITHLDSYWMSDSLRLVMIMPFILSRCLNTTQLKQCFVITVKNNFELTNSRQVKAVIVKTWSLFARLYAKVFANVFHKSDYQALDQLVIKLTRILNKIYPDMITTLPNIHVLQHLPLIAATYGTLQNVSVSLKEMMHEFDLIKRDNILQGLRYVIDNGYNARIPEGGEGWYISVPAHHITRLEEYNTVEQEQENVIEPPQECFFNIRVHKKWNTKRIEKEGFVKKISNEIQKNLYEAYRHYLNKETAISFKTLEYYDAISYTIIKEDNVDINIHVGEVIDIEDDGTKNREYAIIRGIFTHQANDYKKYAFFILDWYYDTGRIDDLTGCKIYGLQESKDVLWPHIHSFHIVDRNPHVVSKNLESESLSKSNDNDNNKLESSFISLLSEKIKSDISWQKNKDCHLSSETPTIGLIREHLSNNKEVIGITSEHVSNMCDKMKVMFMQSQNPSSDAITDVAKILLPEQ